MGLVTAGLSLITDALVGGVAYPRLNNANAALGVGDSSAAFGAAQTDLQGAAAPTNKIRKAMDAGYPQVSGVVITWRATFATTEANFVWNERGIFTAVAAGTGTMLSRRVAVIYSGKTSGLSAQLTCTDTAVLV